MTGAESRLWIQVVRAAVLAFGLGAVAWQRWKKRRLENLAQGWPAVDGRVDYGQVEFIPNSSRSVATLTYDYFIEEYRSGTYTREFSSKADAEGFVRQLKDKRLPIRYNPSKPDESVIEPSDIDKLIPPPISHAG